MQCQLRLLPEPVLVDYLVRFSGGFVQVKVEMV